MYKCKTSCNTNFGNYAETQTFLAIYRLCGLGP